MNLLKTQFTLDDLILEVMRVPLAQLQLNHLQDWVSRLTLKDDLFDQHISFAPNTYQRKLLCRTPRFDLLILCWQPGQASTIHDHQESLNVTRVYRGHLTSRGFTTGCGFTAVPERSAANLSVANLSVANLSVANLSVANLYPVQNRSESGHLESGHLELGHRLLSRAVRSPLRLSQETYLETNDLAVVDRHEIHQLANTSTENLVTLHLYARPLHRITVYCPESGRVQALPVQYTPE